LVWTPHMMAGELAAPLGVAGIQLEVGQMSGDADAEDKGFEQFERFLEHWSRRDFLKRTGGVAAYMAFAAGGLSFLEACGGGTTSTSLTPKKGGHVIEGNFSDIRTLNSMLSSDTASNQVIGLMFDGLLNYSKTGDLVPALAKSMPTTSSDGLTYKFTLRDNLKFSDGQPLTADDVVFTYQLAYDPKYKDVASPRRGDLSKYIASVTAPDPKTVVITTTTVFAPFLANHALYGILPKHVLGTMDAKAINTADFNTAPSVTNGAFKFVKWDKGQQVTLARNDSYWNGPAYLDSYVYKVLPDSVAVSNQLKTSEIDIGPVDPSLFDDLKTASNVAMSEFGVPTFTFYAYNLDPSKLGGQLFGDKAVRQALLYALNRQQIVTAVFFGHGSVTNAGNKQRESMLTVMQQSWKDVGVDATPSLIQFPQLVSQIVSIRTFDIFLVGFNWGADPDVSPLYHSRNTAAGGFNGADFKNDTADQLLDQALGTVDKAKRKSLYFQFQDLMSDLQPSPVILFNSGIYGVNKRVQGTDFGPFNQFAQRPWNAKVWVTDGK